MYGGRRRFRCSLGMQWKPRIGIRCSGSSGEADAGERIRSRVSETRGKREKVLKAGRMFFCRLRRSMLGRFFRSACGRNWNALCWLRRRSRWGVGSTTSGSGWDWSTRASRCCLRTSITRARRCYMCLRICPIRALRSSGWRRRSAFASCSKSRGGARSCFLQATGR